MKIHYLFIINLFLINIFPQGNSIPFFPLEVGNRWDYSREIIIPGGLVFYDSISIEITGTKVLPNNKEYYEFSSFPFIYGYSVYAREENNQIYFYLEYDSLDCLAFQFNEPEGGFYEDCLGFQIYTGGIYSINLWGNVDTQRHQGNFYIFSEHYGIYHYVYDDLEVEDYKLIGCIISGQTYGNLITSFNDIKTRTFHYILEQNYPNPFNPSTTISYQIADEGNVTIKVFDVLGNEVETIVNDQKPAGNYEVKFNGSMVPCGVYFYRLQSGDFIETKKMIILK